MSESTNFYKQIRKEYQGYYIHHKSAHIGRLVRKENSGPIDAFLEQRGLKEFQVKRDYKKFFINSLDAKTQELMKDLSYLEEEQVIAAINTAMLESLNKNLDVSKLEKLHALSTSIPSMKEMTRGGENGIKSRDLFINNVQQAIELIEENSGAAILGTLIEDSLKGTSSVKDLGNKLMQVVQRYESTNLVYIDATAEAAMKEAIRALKNLAHNFQTGKRKDDKELDKPKSWTTIFSNLFSLSFAEGLGARILTSAEMAAEDAVVSMVGSQSGQGMTYVSDSKNSIKTQQKNITQKTDIQGKNFSIKLTENTKLGDHGNINIDVGFSMKFYKNIDFYKPKTTMKGSFASGSGGSLGSALVDVYGNSFHKIYYARNVLAQKVGVSKAQGALHNALLTREILRLFATMGDSKDFAHFIWVNGHFISTLDLLNFAIKQELKYSRSQADKNPNQGIYLSIDGRKEIIKANTKKRTNKTYDTAVAAAIERSRNVNNKIDSARIYAVIHIDKITKAYANKI